jgi:mRNA-degrading endonuclease RelE of RelBE toxin-antitoxin system
VRYQLSITQTARQQLRALPVEVRRNIGFRLDALQEDLTGDLKKLRGRNPPVYRLRIGDHRVLFHLRDGTIEVFTVKDRKEAYDD